MGDKGVSLAGVDWRYMFDIETDIEAQWVGDSPKGERVDIQYPSGVVTTDAARYKTDWWDRLSSAQNDKVALLFRECGIELRKDNALEAAAAFRTMGEEPSGDAPKGDASKSKSARPVTLTPEQAEKQAETLKALRDGQITPLQWFGLDAEIVSGSNWGTFRPDAVAEFSGRMTYKSADEDGALIDAVFSGVVDLCTAHPDAVLSDPREETRRQWERGEITSAKMLLSVTFDVGRAAQKWAPKRYLRQAKGYWKYQRLTQGQFVAIGDLEVRNKIEKSQMTKARLGVFEVRPLPSEPKPVR